MGEGQQHKFYTPICLAKTRPLIGFPWAQTPDSPQHPPGLLLLTEVDEEKL